MRDETNPLQQLIGVRPSVTETVQRSAHTEVTIPLRQAQLAMALRFGQYLMVVAEAGLVAGTVYLLGFTTSDAEGWLGMACLILAIGLGLFGMAAMRPYGLLLARMEAEVSDPNRDSELREMLDAMLAAKQPVVQVVREPVPVTINGVLAEPVSQPLLPLTPGFADLISFVDYAQARGLARADWLPPGGNRVRFPSGTLVTRSVYDHHISQLIDWQLIRQGANGWDWVTTQAEAASRLQLAVKLATPLPHKGRAGGQ